MRRAKHDRDSEQLDDLVPASDEEIMLTPEFRQGVADVRAGRPPNFDGEFALIPLENKKPRKGCSIDSPINKQWNYERGRQFGVLAPPDLKIILPRSKQLNPKALKFLRWRCWSIH